MQNKQVLEDLIDLSKKEEIPATDLVIEYTQNYFTATEVLNISDDYARRYALNFVKGMYRK